MLKKSIWVLISSLMVLSLVIASCGPKEEEAKVTEEGGQVITTKGEEEEVEEEEVVKPSTEEPQYGGTITLAYAWPPRWGLLYHGVADPHQLTHNRIWDGDWARGIAGGYGTGELTWQDLTNVPEYKTGYLAESWRFEVDSQTNEVTTFLKIRQGVHFALVPNSEASRLVGGREFTADDAYGNLYLRFNHPDADNLMVAPHLKGIQPTKIGPWEVSITLPLKDHMSTIMRVFDAGLQAAPELIEHYGLTVASEPMNTVGTGPYMITDYVTDSSCTLKRNPNYWMKDPVGPGMGNQLPYIETVRYLNITDMSSREAALRTANLDVAKNYLPEAAREMSRRVPELLQAPAGWLRISPLYMRTDLTGTPYADVRVRQAMMMAIDFVEINETLYFGLGQILSWPYYDTPAYADMYLALEDPDCPDEVKELYSYNPDKAKELLTEAGYPTGFKTEVVLTATEADYYAIIKDMWSKVGIDLTLQLYESGAARSIRSNLAWEHMTAAAVSPPGTYPEQLQYFTKNPLNNSQITDPYIWGEAEKAQKLAVTDFKGALAITRELMKYLLPQAYCIPTPVYPQYAFWWPWIKNYNGETSVGYFPGDSWVQWVWCDTALKKSMGY